MSFASGFSAGLQLIESQKKYEHDAAIDAAGKKVQEQIDQEKKAKAEQDRLLDLARPKTDNTQPQVEPRVYQKGDSLGLEGYQDTNKPVQTTVQAAPAGYQSRSESDFTNDLSPGGLDYPAANPATEQTLVGNYGTTAAFKGEKPTEADIKSMQTDTTGVPFQPRPFTGKDEQVTSLTDLAANKPVAATQEEVKPKPLDTLNDHITAADRAKDAYDYNTRVIRQLQLDGNARAALDYQSKVATTELTLAQADHAKFTTLSSIAKKGGDLAGNGLERIKQGEDVNKVYFDTMEKLREFGYTGKIPFSLDPRENLRTLESFQKDALTTNEKAELGIKQTVATQKDVMDKAELAIKAERLTLEKINTGIAMNKETRESATASFNRLAEQVKLQFQGINSINSVLDEDYKKSLRPAYEANLKTLQEFSKSLNIPMPNITVGNSLPTKAQVNAAPTANTNVQATVETTNTQPSNNRFSSDVAASVGAKPLSETAGGYVPPTPKTPAQEKQDLATRNATKQNIRDQIQALEESRSSAPMRGAKATARVVKAGYKATSKAVSEGWKSASDWAVGKDDAEVKAQIEKLQKQLDELK